MARDPKLDKDATVEELNAQIAQLKAQLEELAGNLKDQGRGLAADLKARGEDAVDEVRGRASRVYEAAAHRSAPIRARAQGYIDEADTAVRDNPATAMGVAVGVGFLLGLLLTRR